MEIPLAFATFSYNCVLGIHLSGLQGDSAPLLPEINQSNLFSSLKILNRKLFFLLRT